MAVRLRPFLKWVGGKRQLLPVLRRFYPDPMGRYFEPFVGSGAVFFDLVSNGHLNGHGAVLSDDNADLIACYRRVRRSVDEVATALEGLAADHSARGRECYMQVRDGQFNPMRAAWRERGADLDDYPADLAAMLIYLNRTGYNGLFRLNASGEFNVPPGRYDSPKVIDRPLLARGVGSPRLTRDSHRARGLRSRPARGGRRRLRLFRSAVRAAERNGELPRLHGTRVFGCRSGAPATGAHHACGARRPGAPQQLRGALD